MHSPRDLRRRIRSISSTAQITKAMQMVAASKMRRAQLAALAGRPFVQVLYRIQREATTRMGEFSHPLLESREVHKRAVILVGADKGLCGALNSNVCRLAADFDPQTTLYITAGRKAAQFIALAKAIGRPDLPQDERFVDWPARLANDAALRAIIEGIFAEADDKTWEARLTEADVPCSRVWSIPEIVAHPQLAHRDVLQRVETAYGPQTFVGSGFRLAHGGGRIDRPPALPGAHAEEILEEAGYGEAEIAALRREGAI